MDDSPDIYGDEPEDEAPALPSWRLPGSRIDVRRALPAPAPAPPPVVTAAPAQPYRVLARKYRRRPFPS
jgi:DNA polymerase-3 subunit gamma/tau